MQRFKTVISTGEVLVEVKHGSMVFDSSLIIITTNIPPDDMSRHSRACGIDNEDAMYRRFCDTAGAHCIPTSNIARNNLVEHLVKVISKNIKHIHDIEINVEYVIRSIPGVCSLIYNDLDINACDCKKYFQ